MSPPLAVAVGLTGMFGFVACCASRLEGWGLLAGVGVSLALYGLAFTRPPPFSRGGIRGTARTWR